MRLTLHAGGETRLLQLRLVGRHMVYPALAAVAVGLAEGRTLNEVTAALEELTPGLGKMQPLPLVNGAFALQDDAKGAAATFDAALDTLAAIPAPYKTVVFGEIRYPPLPEAATYGRLGERIAAIADRAIFVGGRFEDYRAGAIRGGLQEDRFHRAEHAQDAITLLRNAVDPGEVVLLKGLWQQRLGRVGLALSGRDVQCRADPCPFKRTMCSECPFLSCPTKERPGRPALPPRIRVSVEVPDASPCAELVNEAAPQADHHHQLVAVKPQRESTRPCWRSKVVLPQMRHFKDCLAFCSACSQVIGRPSIFGGEVSPWARPR